MKVLVAGIGNVLRCDDGFGVAVARRLLEDASLPPQVTVLEAGIAGVRVVQELLDGYDGLIIVDAIARGGTPGTIYELEPEAGDQPPTGPATAPASLHLVGPSAILTLARAAGCLPARVAIIGCEPAECDELALEPTPAVAAAVPRAAALIHERIRAWEARGTGP
jgi:hydrogenase maturation protease